jgi:NitT/TauT family transport system substrate-binding protein
VASPGSSTHRFLNYLLARHGLAVSDISTVGVGVNFQWPPRFSTARWMRPSRVHSEWRCSRKSRPAPSCRLPQGARAAGTLGTSNLPSSALMVRPEWGRANADIVCGVGKATRRSLAWMQAHSPEDISNAVPQDCKVQDAAMYPGSLFHHACNDAPSAATPPRSAEQPGPWPHGRRHPMPSVIL